MSIFSKAKKLVRKVTDKVGVTDEKKKPAPYVDPDPINPLTGRPVSQNVNPLTGQVGQQPSAPSVLPMQGLGQMMPSYLPAPVSMSQRVPNGLGSASFRSTLAPLQQQGYGLGQIDPRFLTSIQQLPGGSFQPAMPQPQAPAQMPQMQPQMQPPMRPVLGRPIGLYTNRMFQ